MPQVKGELTQASPFYYVLWSSYQEYLPDRTDAELKNKSRGSEVDI